MPYVGILRAAGMAKESSVGTLNATPDVYIPYIPPDGFTPMIHTLETAGIRFNPQKPVKATQGPAEIKGAKLKIEVEPENIGEILMACFGADALSGTALLGYTHLFTRLASAQLPTYTWWLDRGTKFPQFVGSMLHKLDIGIKVKEFVMAESEWVSLSYDDTGTSKSPTYSQRKAFVFNEAVIKINGTPVLDYDNVKIAIDNEVKAEHALASTIYTKKIWSEGQRTVASLDLYVENATEYNKYLAAGGTTAALDVVISSAETIVGTSPLVNYSLAFSMPVLRYLTAPFHNPVGVLKIPFTGVAVYDFGTTKTINATLVNSRSTSY